MPPMFSTPRTIQMKNGPQKAYMPLQAMPRAVPHMELPLYQNENAGIANRPEMAKIKMAGSVMAPARIVGTLAMSPPKAARTGKAMTSSSRPAVSWRMAMPMR